jgi:hypothetical protein
MRLAVVCDDLVQFGGQERLVTAIHEIWPKAPIYTSLASQEWQEIAEKEKIDLRTSYMQKIPGG